MKSVACAGLEEPGRLEAEVADEQQPGRPDRLDGERLALRHDEALLVAEPRGHGRRDEEQHEPRVGEQRRELHPAVAVAVEVRRAVGDLARTTNRWRREHGRDVVGAATPAISARSGSLGSKNGSGWTTRISARLAPQAGRPVERAGDDREDQHDEPDAEPGRAEHVEQLEPLQRVHDARAERRVVLAWSFGHLVRVVGGRAEREARQLAERHADDREQAAGR